MSETKQFRMLQRAQIDGVWYEPGAIVCKPSDWKGPHKTIVGSHHGAALTGPGHHDRRHEPANIADHLAHTDNLVDVPLYEEVGVTESNPSDL